jgi:hypothetical protein
MTILIKGMSTLKASGLINGRNTRLVLANDLEKPYVVHIEGICEKSYVFTENIVYEGPDLNIANNYYNAYSK